MSNFQRYVGSWIQVFPDIDLTAIPGTVYDFGSLAVPTRWFVTDAGPATGIFDNAVVVGSDNGTEAPTNLVYVYPGEFVPASNLSLGSGTFAPIPTSFTPLSLLGSGASSGDPFSWTTSSTVIARSLGWKIVTTAAEMEAAIVALGSNPGTIYVPVGVTATYSGAMTQPPDGTMFRGGDHSSQIVYSGTGTMATWSNASRIGFDRLRISISGTSGTLFNLANCFRLTWVSCLVTGSHNETTGTTYHGQIGWNLNSNTGDCRWINCDINNLGEAFQPNSQISYAKDCVFGTNWRTFHGGDPTGASYAAGMAISGCTFHGAVDTGSGSGVGHHILVDGAANNWFVHGSWFEKCDKAIEAGTSSYGPIGFFLGGISKLSAATTSLIIATGVKQASLRDIVFGDDGAVSGHTDLVVSSADGIAENLLAKSGFEVPLSTFPVGWTYFPRSNAESSQLAGKNVYIGAGVSAGTASYFNAGGGSAGAARARVGYDGTRTILGDVGGGRDVALVSGSTPRQVAMGNDGSFYVGSKTANTANAGGCVGGVVIANAPTVPTSNPTAAGVLYVNNGALCYRGSSGTVTTIAPA